VGPVYLFDLASRQAQWLSARQATVAGNIANADTPGFKPQDVEPFVDALDNARLAMATTSTGHLGAGATASDAASLTEGESWAVKVSGNAVTLEAELLKAGEVGRAYSLNTAIVKAFHRMMMTTVKG
jgi:flagellar basal-body rod protein FlgB